MTTLLCLRCQRNQCYTSQSRATDADGQDVFVLVKLCQPCRTKALRECAAARAYRGAGAVVGPAPW